MEEQVQQTTDQAANLEEQQTHTEQQEKMLAQSEVNNLVAKEAKKAQEKLLRQLGIEDFNSAKDGLQKFREWSESQKSDLEKQQEQLQRLDTSYKAVETENKTLKAQLSALKAGIRADSVEDVIVLANAMVSDEVSIDEAIVKVVEKYPHFKGEGQQEQSQPNIKFTTGQHQKSSGAITKEQFNQMSYTEKLDLYNSNYELYQQLSK